MNTKIISMLALAALALVAVPSSQAAESTAAINCDFSDFIQVTDSDSEADAIYIRDVCAATSGCTTDLASAQTGTTNTYVNRVYNEPVSVANVVSWHAGLAVGTAFNAVDYALCIV